MKQQIKRSMLVNLPYLIVGYVGNKMSWLFYAIRLKSLTEKILYMLNHMGIAFQNPFPSFAAKDLWIGLLTALLFKALVYLKDLDKKKLRTGVEHGSARWGTKEDIAPFMDKEFSKNLILTKSERLMLSNRPKRLKYARNNNVIVIGGSGSGKTTFWLLPNLLQMHSSYVVTDPKGTIVLNCGKMLVDNGYDVVIFNTVDFKKSMKYNPFAYIHSEKDILKLVTILMANTKGEGKGGDPFWDKSESLLYSALIGYIHYEAPLEEQNFATLIEFINSMEVREDDEDFKNPIDYMFEELERRNPKHFAVRQYKKYKLAAGKTAKSILVSCGARLAPFDIQELRELTFEDELHLDTL